MGESGRGQSLRCEVDFAFGDVVGTRTYSTGLRLVLVVLCNDLAGPWKERIEDHLREVTEVAYGWE